MSDIFVSVSTKTFLADLVTPVLAYLRVRDHFRNPLLLESTDFRGKQNRFSILCLDPVFEFYIQDDSISRRSSLWKKQTPPEPIQEGQQVRRALADFHRQFVFQSSGNSEDAVNGIFGYQSYGMVRYYENLDLDKSPQESIPDCYYALYRYVVGFDHHSGEMKILQNTFGSDSEAPYSIEEIRKLISSGSPTSYPFKRDGDEWSTYTDDEYKSIIEKCIVHIKRGDVFQIVPSRSYIQKFIGDDFLVYRALRAINPSPYLFYFDLGGFHIFGSSPESQLIVQDGKVSIFPIAGTYRRTGDEVFDSQQVEALLKDPKENAEHVMLVDLARNDLSRHCSNVTVDVYKEPHFYSHVIHLVSRVTGILKKRESVFDLVADTFPAGTLSGAPKFRAMQLLNDYEITRRTYYGGAIGYFDTKGNTNHAIMIRSFLSQNNHLYRQAGGGVVVNSEPLKEVQEARNKLMALKQAIIRAEEELL